MAADLNELVSGIWPLALHRQTDGSCSLSGMSLNELANKHATPMYLYDADELLERAIRVKSAFAKHDLPCDVNYASKAFLSIAMAKIIANAGLHLDVASGGELAIALRAGFPAANIAMHGDNKSEAEIDLAIRSGIGCIILDSEEEVQRVAQVAVKYKIVQQVMIRATLGIDAHTHEFISTSHEDQKFGLSVNDGSLLRVAKVVKDLISLELIGLHSHIGSQILPLAGFEAAAARLVTAAVMLRDEAGIVISQLGLGGGFGISYVPADQPKDIQVIADLLVSTVLRESKLNDLIVSKISVEPGRYISGPAGITLYTVGTIKPVTIAGGQTRTYVSVDGGMSDNIRTALYGAQYTVAVVSRAPTGAPMLSRVVGKHCESGDIIVRDCYLPDDLKPGDLIAVAATGAYCRSMSSQYNGTPRPPVIAVSGGLDQVWIRRETYEDLLVLDQG